MKTRIYALVMGIVFLVIGVLGFVPGLVSHPEGLPPLAVETGHGLLLGLFAVNVLHNLVHLAFGLCGVVVWRSFVASRIYARATTAVYAVLLVMGLVPGLHTLFGLVPLHGADVWLHAAIAVVSAYFAYAPAVAVERPGRL
jgi:hypothetical protein